MVNLDVSGGGIDNVQPQAQFLRKVELLVFGGDASALNLSQLRIKFSVKRTQSATPNTADIRIYNLADDTAKQIRKEFTRVILQGGYESNFGVIFQGNIKQVILGRESATDTFVDLICGDGDRAYNFAVVNTTIKAGGSQVDQINAAIKSMNSKGVAAGHLGDFPKTKLARGKAMFGNARNYLRNAAETSGKSWSIQDEKVNFIGDGTYLPQTAVVLTSKTGMIGTPQQTNYGVNIKCLLNPLIGVGTRVKIDNASVQREKLNLEQIAAAKGDVGQILSIRPRDLQADGMYYVLVLECNGDTRGIDWYCNLVCLSVDVTANPRNSIQSG